MKMINDDILAIKDNILTTVGENCEKIYLFGSYAYGAPTPRCSSNLPCGVSTPQRPCIP